MENRGITCEPNYILPERVTIEKLKDEKKEKVAKTCLTREYVQVNARREELEKTFSMKQNEYLTCKWNKFLDDVPKDVLIIKHYTEFKKRKPPVRRMILNGSFYLASGKLIPVPYLRDPRK